MLVTTGEKHSANAESTCMTTRKWLFCIVIAACTVPALIAAYFVLLQPLPNTPTFEQIRDSYLQSEGLLLDRNGDILHELRTDNHGRRLEWIPFSEISPALKSAIIAGEDHRFYKHGGVDWISFISAMKEAIRFSAARGASTITMQLASMLDDDLHPKKNRRSAYQKTRQIRAARAYEKSWSKQEILEAYLNLVTFRGELQGVNAASRGLFDKAPQGLTEEEGFILAALVQSPNSTTGGIAARACALAKMTQSGVDPAALKRLAETVLTRPYTLRPRLALAPHVAIQLFSAHRAFRGHSPQKISCTLDRGLQAFTREALSHHLLSVQSQNMHDGAALIVDNRTGEVLAYVGNTGEQSSARYIDGVRAMRQAGSTLKPFIYALAFEQRLITPASIIEDSPLDIPVQGGIYRPRNYDNRFHGLVTARIALASSLNVPAVKTLELTGVDGFVERLRQLGFDQLRSPEFYGLALALGSADVTLWDLVNGYRTLANGGSWNPLQLRQEENSRVSRRVLSAESSFLISDILSDRESRSYTFSLESPLATRFWTAVKTGTSKDMRDNWCIGFSDSFTVGVWTGNFSGESMWNVSGITGAAPVWIEIMNWLHRSRGSRRPQPPAGIMPRTVQIEGLAQTRQEWFIAGTETASVGPAQNQESARILYPASGTIIALDPDIPFTEQKVFFEAAPAGGLLWVLDGRTLGPAADMVPWAPRPGKHVLKLLDEDQKEFDSVDFEVRGNPIPE
jgi:penicillin-binding protein 1C